MSSFFFSLLINAAHLSTYFDITIIIIVALWPVVLGCVRLYVLVLNICSLYFTPFDSFLSLHTDKTLIIVYFVLCVLAIDQK